jgi:phenylalanine-4-hydroxylase
MTRGFSPPGVPEHLRRFVVEQDYGAYDAVDQAVWRFVLLQLSSRLGRGAHPAYERGLSATGISVDAIPRIAEMNERLAGFGWGAVCVDGFIPPRAFQEFQACGLLPIAAEIRRREHLVYTPAPDIIHEAAGHAPILPDPIYAAYLRRVGELGAQAFTLPEDNAVHDATYALSELKEDDSASAEAVQGAERALAQALNAVPEPSEAARLSRLYWWTAEYGLVGRTDDYRVYGAGLLSSLGESHSCHAESVRKLPLDERCLELAYDITRPQPQLFVARDFEALHELLDRVEPSLARSVGGALALSLAERSRELVTLSFDSGAQAIGVLGAVVGDPQAPALLVLEGRCALLHGGVMLDGHGPSAHPDGLWIAVGRLASGARLECLQSAELESHVASIGRRLSLQFENGAIVEGRLERVQRLPDGRTAVIELSQARIEVAGRAPVELASFALLAAGAFITAEPGAVDKHFYPASEPSSKRVPRPRQRNPDQRSLLDWYARAAALRAAPDGELEARFAEAERWLCREHPREWLLRFVLLEELTRRGLPSALTRSLEATLERLEIEYAYEQPIASALAYLRRVA